MTRYIDGWDRHQTWLLPECVDDYVDENNPVRAIEAFVGQLNLSDLGFDRAIPAETGRPGYHPATAAAREASRATLRPLAVPS